MYSFPKPHTRFGGTMPRVTQPGFWLLDGELDFARLHFHTNCFIKAAPGSDEVV